MKKVILIILFAIAGMTSIKAQSVVKLKSDITTVCKGVDDNDANCTDQKKNSTIVIDEIKNRIYIKDSDGKIKYPAAITSSFTENSQYGDIFRFRLTGDDGVSMTWSIYTGMNIAIMIYGDKFEMKFHVLPD